MPDYKTIGIIPARMGSTRLARKMLLEQTGLPLVIHTASQAKKAAMLDDLIVATDSTEIEAVVIEAGFKAVMTSPEHQSGTDRVAEAAQDIEADFIVNIQGDMPELPPQCIDLLIQGIQESDADMATLGCTFDNEDDFKDPNTAKIILNKDRDAVYFSRAPIPFPRDNTFSEIQGFIVKHIGIYAFKRSFLFEFSSMQPGTLEQIEKLEQLRAIENGKQIRIVHTDRYVKEVETASDYQAFVSAGKQK